MTRRWALTKRYLRGWFAVDLLSVMPFQLFLRVDPTLLVLRGYKLSKVTRLLRCAAAPYT